jgi:hypothetical protein
METLSWSKIPLSHKTKISFWSFVYKKSNQKMKLRRIRYAGDHKDESILISNHGNVQFIADGRFALSGLMYCPRYTVEFMVSGQGTISLRGACKKLIIKNIAGNCLLDLSEVVCNEVYCKSAKGKSIILVGSTKRISLANLDEEAILQYKGRPLITNCSVKESAKMERLSKKEQKILEAA